MDEVFARLDAEDRAVVYLGKLPRQVALATALKVELLLATRWEEEQSEMLRRNDPREAVQIYPEDFQKIDRASAEIPPDINSDAAAEKHVIDLLADFPRDRAWWIARTVVMYEAAHARIGKTDRLLRQHLFRNQA